MLTTLEEFILEILSNQSIEDFLKGKHFKNAKSKSFFYHGTSVKPEEFKLKEDYDFSQSHTWSGDLPEGYLFLTSDLKEAKCYGRYIIPCELKKSDSLTFKLSVNNPSQIFDRDYGIDLYKNDKEYDFWGKFEDSMKSVLVIKGTDKMTLITDIHNVIPRTDLAIEYYKDIK